jgi:putative ABC transport system substrate-binding protein
MRELGYTEGRDFLIEYRFAEGRNDRLPGLAAELVSLKVDVIVAPSTLAALPAKAATKSIPIVAASGEPVETGLVASLARPGGNVTGVTSISNELIGKRLELLKEIVPGISRVGVLWDGDGPVPVIGFKMTRNLATTLGLQIQSLEIRGSNPDLEAAFKVATNNRVRGLIIISNPLVNSLRAPIAGLAAKYRLPALYSDTIFMNVGGLMFYGANRDAMYSRLGYYVDKILKGAKPADLPVEQPTVFELIINLKTAKALGIKIPQSILLRADRVIE